MGSKGYFFKVLKTGKGETGILFQKRIRQCWLERMKKGSVEEICFSSTN